MRPRRMGLNARSVVEPGLPSNGWPTTPGSDVFGVRAAVIPSSARAIYDDSRSVIIGWQWETADGWVLLASPDGTVLNRSEKGLESPLIDPLDLMFIIGGLVRVFVKGAAEGGARMLLGRVAGRTVASQLTAPEAAMVVGRAQSIDRMPLLFTRTVLGHMQTPARFVPVQIIRMAISYGAKSPDPRGVAGVVRYFIPMVRNGREYGLEVLLRENDRTVMHVKYAPGMKQ